MGNTAGMSDLISDYNNKYIISEYYTFESPNREMIIEAEKKHQPIVMSGILQKADTLNKNGRVYPYDILKREADNYMELIKENVAGGELDHPDSAVVSLANVSHRVVEMWWNNKELWGRVQIADTPAGDTLKGLLKSGFKLGISSRGVGSVKSEGDRDIVQDDFELIAFDYVSNPSTPGAYLFKEGYMRPVRNVNEGAKTIGDLNKLQLLSQKEFWKSM